MLCSNLKILQEALDEAKGGMLTAKTQLAEFQIKNVQEKEKLLKEMQQLANALEKSRDEIKQAKETEDGLRSLIKSYDEKFTSLQKALQDTNGAYAGFKSEMEKVTLVPVICCLLSSPCIFALTNMPLSAGDHADKRIGKGYAEVATAMGRE